MIYVIIHLLLFSSTGLYIVWAGTMAVIFFAAFPEPSVVPDIE